MKFVKTSDGLTCPDDLIPLAMRNGFQSNSASMFYAGRTEKEARNGMSPAFEARVFDAVKRIKYGEDVSGVRNSHGCIVVSQAIADIAKRRRE